MGHRSDNKKSLFWTSYSDLMTSLFFAMLVLFIVIVIAMGQSNKTLNETIAGLQNNNLDVTTLNQQLRETKDKLAKLQKDTAYLHQQLREADKRYDQAIVTKQDAERIANLQMQFKTLSSSRYLKYSEEKYMFYVPELEGKEIFQRNEAIIKSEYENTIEEIGKEIKQLIETLSVGDNRVFKYQLVIEGMAAIPYNKWKSNHFNPDDESVYILSYKRALALYKFWQKKNLNFRGRNTEIIIAGSGYNGENRDNINQDNNKRFVIQIIPKINRPIQ